MKKNLSYIITYVFFIAALLFLLLIYRQVFFVLILLLLLILPCITIPVMLLTYRTLKLNIAAECDSVEEGNPIHLKMDVTSSSRLPLLDLRLSFSAHHLFFDETKNSCLSFPLLPHKSNTVYIPFDTLQPGMLQVDFTSLYMADIMHLYCKEIPLSIRVCVPILPRCIEVSPIIPAPGSDSLEEYTEFDNRGSTSTDIKEIREYRPGDRLQRIHWKLSAKLDDLFVKEFEQTSTLSVVLLPELLKEKLPETLRTMYSLARYLIKQDERFQICLYQHSSCDFTTFIITDEALLQQCFVHICYLPQYDIPDAALLNFRASGQKSGILVHITGDEITFEESE